MQMARVIGMVVATQKDPKLVGFTLQLVQPIDIVTGDSSGKPIVAADTVGAGIGDVVMIVSGSSARLTIKTTGSPVDMAIVGIIDSVDVEGVTIYDRAREDERALGW
ncbi:MAG: EutN/CcmL family microcompartment protein [Firmicutes bacterium]|nr:EutN/CcmL family microcompartment protein [Bacillota bacterium]